MGYGSNSMPKKVRGRVSQLPFLVYIPNTLSFRTNDIDLIPQCQITCSLFSNNTDQVSDLLFSSTAQDSNLDCSIRTRIKSPLHNHSANGGLKILHRQQESNPRARSWKPVLYQLSYICVLLTYLDSNQDKQNQNLSCYRYTISQ